MNAFDLPFSSFLSLMATVSVDMETVEGLRDGTAPRDALIVLTRRPYTHTHTHTQCINEREKGGRRGEEGRREGSKQGREEVEGEIGRGKAGEKDQGSKKEEGGKDG